MTYSKARDGSLVCSYNSMLLHSAYNPIREAERFVLSLDTHLVPDFVVITEPALSYTAQFFRNRFPNAKIFAVRYCADFAAKDSLWDGVFYADMKASVEERSRIIQMALYNALGEEGLFSTLFCAWPPSARAFPDEDGATWRAIQSALHLARDILATRTVNASRWVLNAFSLAVRVNNAAVLQKGNSSIVVAASGESLMSSLPLLKARRNQYFLIALSSALLPLHSANLECDLCITTDGGFYAKGHLSSYSRSSLSPLAVAAEGNCPADVLEKETIIPLVYPDGPASDVVRLCIPQAMMAMRNGTVSGTALHLARSLTTGNIYFCGLDLCGGAGRQHCPPNAFELSASWQDNRLRTAESRVTASRFASSSLEIYRQWFALLNANEVSNVFRLSSGVAASATCGRGDSAISTGNVLSAMYPYGNTLGNIRDVSFKHFYECLDSSRDSQLPQIVPCPLLNTEERIQAARCFVDKESGTHKWLSAIFPADCISIAHTSDAAEKTRREAALKAKNDALLAKINRILHKCESGPSFHAGGYSCYGKPCI